MTDYSMLPEHMQEVARDYVEKGYEPGGFLFAVLSNDLVDAFGRADAINRAAMGAWAVWLLNEAPSTCWGSAERIHRWVTEARGR